MDRTTRVIERRATLFRNLVVVVVAIGLAAFAVAIVARWSAGLAALVFLVPACGYFFYADVVLLNDWRCDVLASWVRRDIDIAAFCQAIRAYPALPRKTTEAMLATLPRTSDIVAERKIGAPTRQAVAATSGAAHRARADALLLATAASVIVAGSVAAAIAVRTWRPLLCLTTLLLYPVFASRVGRRRRTAADAAAEATRHQGLSDREYQGLIANLE
jgi:hypothetical protein